MSWYVPPSSRAPSSRAPERLCLLQDALNCLDQPIELGALRPEVLPSRGGERVIPRPPVVLGWTPLGTDVVVEQQTLQGGVQRALAHLQHVFGNLAHPLRDAVAVPRP